MAHRLQYAGLDGSVIETRLYEREHERRLLLLFKLAIGIPATFFAPWVLASIIAEIARRFGSPIAFWPLFTLLSATLLPLILWRATRHRTDFMGEAAADMNIGTAEVYRANSYGEWEMRHTWLTWAAYQELFFWGPYILIDAYTAWRGDRATSLTCRARAVMIIEHLLHFGEGVAFKDLLNEGEPRQHLNSALKYLHRHEWIDLSERRDRVWLLSEAREKLAKR